jgi:predicted DNA-binding transcriptional regulator AlpA
VSIEQSQLAPLLVTTTQAARILGVCTVTLLRDRTRRFPPPVRLSSRCLRWSVRALQEWVDEQVVDAERTQKKHRNPLQARTDRI